MLQPIDEGSLRNKKEHGKNSLNYIISIRTDMITIIAIPAYTSTFMYQMELDFVSFLVLDIRLN